jgi:hypothetical protein
MATATRKVDTKGRVILPDRFAGQVVAVDQVSDTEVRIRLTKAPRKRPSLDALLSRVTAKNVPEKVDLGTAVGNERL